MTKNTLLATLLATTLIFAGTATYAADGDGAAKTEKQGKRGGDRGQHFIKAADTDNDGKVSEEEMTAFKAAQLAKYDTDNDGELSRDEMQAMQADRKAERATARFDRLDTDGNGSLSQEELSNGHKMKQRGGQQGHHKGHKGGKGGKGGGRRG